MSYSKAEIINNFVKTYRSLAELAIPVDGKILSSNLIFTKVITKWTQKNIEKGEATCFQKHHVLDSKTSEIIYESIPEDISNHGLSKTSYTGNMCCIIKEIKQESKPKQYLEIWSQKGLLKNFDVNAFDIHGNIYTDGEFGSLEWSPNEDRILYIAEKKLKKAEPFYKQKSSEKNKLNEELDVGGEYIYKPDWGEQLVDKHQPILGLCDLQSETLKVLDGIPLNFSPGQVIWSKDGSGVYGVVFENEPRRLGLIYCTNRISFIFHLTLNGKFKILSGKSQSVRSPRLSLDGKYLFWIQRPVGGAHGGCHELIRYNINTEKSDVLINIVTKGDKHFSGLYMHKLPVRCFSKDGKKLFFSTLNRTKITSYFVDLETTSVHSLNTEDSSSNIIDVHEDIILLSTGSLQDPPSLKLIKLKEMEKMIPLTKTTKLIKDSVLTIIDLKAEKSLEDFDYYNAIYYGPPPPATSGKYIPLIVYPHGGPHSAIFNDFLFEFNFFVSIGYGVLAVNFRGSTGVGQDGIDFLRGRLGKTDVEDIQGAVNYILKSNPYLDSKNIYVYGKSYGGYLVGQLTAQYPDFYRAAVNFNGVSEITSMYTMSDIPDWATTEAGFVFDESKPLPLEDLSKMMKMSPINYCQKIKAPTFFMVGKKDLRVPYHQSLRMYNALKARDVKVRLNLYEDNHTLGSVPAHIDTVINSALWFLENRN